MQCILHYINTILAFNETLVTNIIYTLLEYFNSKFNVYLTCFMDSKQKVYIKLIKKKKNVLVQFLHIIILFFFFFYLQSTIIRIDKLLTYIWYHVLNLLLKCYCNSMRIVKQ